MTHAESCRSALDEGEWMRSWSRCVILGRELIRNISNAFSTPSIPPSLAEWGWASRFAAPSSTHMGDGCGQLRMNLGAPHFSSPCRQENRIYEFPAAGL